MDSGTASPAGKLLKEDQNQLRNHHGATVISDLLLCQPAGSSGVIWCLHCILPSQFIIKNCMTYLQELKYY